MLVKVVAELTRFWSKGSKTHLLIRILSKNVWPFLICQRAMSYKVTLTKFDHRPRIGRNTSESRLNIHSLIGFTRGARGHTLKHMVVFVRMFLEDINVWLLDWVKKITLIIEDGNHSTHWGPAAAAKSLQSCPTMCDPIDGSPPGSPVPGILQARTLEWVAISFSNAWKWKLKVKLISRVWLLATPWTAAYQAPPSMGFSRQEYWSGVPAFFNWRPK